MKIKNHTKYSRRTFLWLLATATCVFVAGVILLVIGFYMFTRVNKELPYMWSVNLCKIPQLERWVGFPLLQNEKCPTNLTSHDDGLSQTFKIPDDILLQEVPYYPVIYITNKVKGNLKFTHKLNGKQVYTTSARLSSLSETKFEVCGGKEIIIMRDGPLSGAEGDYITTDCENQATGCQYEPGRSLNQYSFTDDEYIELPKHGETSASSPSLSDSSELIVDEIILEADATSIIMPDAYIKYRVGGIGKTQRTGLILLVVGGLMADIMPAILFFLLAKPHVPPPSHT
eukprot:TRINITY_DN4385_c0_g1_i1.p1 TRINITY_DN4385_c0_g1~~TRINITY_DN4385_c0_g1_i1.p1  ORF type:complete len:286 (-),score=72.60 TRINITY_DN4385_c0_g1_i1:18-875(-)